MNQRLESFQIKNTKNSTEQNGDRKKNERGTKYQAGSCSQTNDFKIVGTRPAVNMYPNVSEIQGFSWPFFNHSENYNFTKKIAFKIFLICF